MNLKGIKINKKMYKKIDEIGVSNIKNTMFKGLDEFKKFSWANFVKQEFEALINSLSFLEKNGVINHISEKQLFVFNYYTDVTEMDIATVLENDEGQNVIVDIEYKSGNEAKEKLDEQIIKRVHEHMNQLFLDSKYVIIAMTADGFYRANYYNQISNADINSLEKLKEIFKNLHANDRTESVLTQANDLAGINKLYLRMESGDFNYYEETKRTTEFIIKKLDEGKKSVLCLSSPGTGKTVVAFKLFFENINYLFLIMNQKFYCSLGLTKYFSSKRCFYGTDALLSNDLTDKVVIIDEVQRLNKEMILKIINNSNATILFGDTGQAFLRDDLDLDEKGLISYLKTNGVYVHQKTMKRSKRFNDSVEDSLNFLTSRNATLKEKIELDDYSIKLFYDEEDFISEYNNCNGSKKMFTTFDKASFSHIELAGKKFFMADKDFFSFAISIACENMIGHTLHAISFDVENNFVVLKDVGIIHRNKKDIIINKNKDNTDEKRINKFLNELNILFTRGKKRLCIYVDDLEVYLYLNKKLKEIIQK